MRQAALVRLVVHIVVVSLIVVCMKATLSTTSARETSMFRGCASASTLGNSPSPPPKPNTMIAKSFGAAEWVLQYGTVQYCSGKIC